MSEPEPIWWRVDADLPEYNVHAVWYPTEPSTWHVSARLLEAIEARIPKVVHAYLIEYRTADSDEWQSAGECSSGLLEQFIAIARGMARAGGEVRVVPLLRGEPEVVE